MQKRNRFLISKTKYAKTIAMSHPTPANHDINKQGKKRQWIDAVSVAWKSQPRETRSSNHKLLSGITLHLSSAPHGIEHSWIYRKHYHLSKFILLSVDVCKLGYIWWKVCSQALSQKISEFPNVNWTGVSRLPIRLFYHWTIGSETASMMVIRDLVRNIDMPVS